MDKFNEAGLTLEKAHRLVKAPLIKECIGHLECYLRDIKEAGDYLFVYRRSNLCLRRRGFI
jgi:flavin reductase (DIM6/NTAB) family NADH-FMN oxidoreductase RutF